MKINLFQFIFPLMMLLSNILFAALPRIAVLDIGGEPKDFSPEQLSAVASRFETELQQTGQVQVLERRNMDLILQEQGFQQSGACNSSECQVQVGQLLGVDRIFTGSLVRIDQLLTLNIKMVDVGSGEVLLSHALDIRGSLEDLLRGGCYEMAQIFAGLKKPDGQRSVLTAERRSPWPWIVGGVVATAAIITTIVILQDEPTERQALIE